MENCPNCGGKLIGNGFNTPVHCENITVPSDTECDANPIFCMPIDEEAYFTDFPSIAMAISEAEEHNLSTEVVYFQLLIEK